MLVQTGPKENVIKRYPRTRIGTYPDQTFHINVDPDPALHQMMQIYDLWSTDPPVPEFIDPVFAKASPKR